MFNSHISKRIANIPQQAIPKRFKSPEAYAENLGVSLRNDSLGTSALKDFRELPDVLEITAKPDEQQVAAWADLAQNNPQMGAVALNGIEESADTEGQRMAGRMLRRRVIAGGDKDRRAAILFGGLVPFEHLSTDKPTLKNVGKAAFDIMVGSQTQDAANQAAYIESGLKALYTLALSQGDVDFKTELPLASKEKNMEDLSELLLLDPDFKGLPKNLNNGEVKPSGPPRVANELFKPALPGMLTVKEQADDFAALARVFNDTEIDQAGDDPNKLVLKGLPFESRDEAVGEGLVDIEAQFDNFGNLVQLEANPGRDGRWEKYSVEGQDEGFNRYAAQSQNGATSFFVKDNVFHKRAPV